MSKHLLLYLLIFLFCFLSSSWSQTMWTKYPGNPVLNTGPSGTWEQTAVAQPSVIYDGTTYHMWYGGLSSFNDLTSQIGYATSSDGKNWTKYASNPVFSGGGTGAWDRGVGPGSVILVNGVYHLYYTGYDGTYYRIGHATSTDKVSWTRDPNNPILNLGPSGTWDDWWVSIPSVIFNGSTFHMWYAGYDGTHDRIGYATSPDGSTWTKHSSNPVLDLGPTGSWDDWWTSGCSVLFNGSSYEMWYSGHDGSRVRIGYVTSPDGIIWDKYIYNPVLDVGLSGSWDQYWVWCPKVVFNGSDYKMWYQGQSSGNTCLVGYATAPVTINVPGDVPTIQAGIDSASDGNIVLVADGTYLENINFNGKAITVASRFLMDGDTNHISNTIIDGSQPSHPDSGSVVYFVSGEDTNSVLYGFTIENGSGTAIPSYNDRSGGGIFMFPSGGRISHNNIKNNSVTTTSSTITGVGILAAPVANYVIIEHNNIHSNTGTVEINGNCAGGGIGIIGNLGESRILSNKIYNNTIITQGSGGTIGAGIYCGDETSGISLIKDNLIKDNICQPAQTHSQHGGAGIRFYRVSGKLINNRIINNSFTGNHGGGGGVLLTSTSSLEIYNNIISGNLAKWGGAIYSSGMVYIINSTIENNSSDFGGGIYVTGTQADLKVMNTIIWSNSALTGPGIHVDSGKDSVVYSDIQGANVFPGAGNMNQNPIIIADSLDNTSPCIGAGIDVFDFGGGVVLYCPPYDINGRFRPFPADSMPDMGACESLLGSPVVGLETTLSNNLPKSYDLKQNFPNPANPSTTIEFDLPKTGHVTLKIFNILGQEVETLVSDRLSAGLYKYRWNASNLASGVYLYRLEADGFVQTKKLILMK